MGIKNLNATVVPSEEDVRYAEARMGKDLFRYYSSMPIYLIDPPLMDIIYPPERKRFIGPDCAERVLEGFEEGQEEEGPFDMDSLEDLVDKWIEDLEKFWNRLEECLEVFEEPSYLPEEYDHDSNAPDEYYGYLGPDSRLQTLPSASNQPVGRPRRKRRKLFSAMGAYFASVPLRVVKAIEEHCGVTIGTGPTIFICPEKVERSAKQLFQKSRGISEGWLFRFVFAYILIHELAHAFMDGGLASPRPWERIIEESLANAYAFSRLSFAGGQMRNKEASVFLTEVGSQPLAYQGWEFFSENGHLSLKTTARAWKKRTIPTGSSGVPLFNHVLGSPLNPAGLLHFPFMPFLHHPGLSRRFTRHLRHFYEEFYFHLPHPWDRIFRDIWLRGTPPYHILKRTPNLSKLFWISLSTFIFRNVAR